MLKNHFHLALRFFQKNKLFGIINVAGLAIGISAALVIYLIVQYEFNFDTRHKDGDRIYRVVSNLQLTDLVIHTSGVPIPTVDAVRNEVTGIEGLTHFVLANEMKVSVPVKGSQSPAVFRHQDKIIYADENYFNFIEYAWLAGSRKTALKDAYQVVLTESRARAYFTNPVMSELLGQTIIYDDSIKATVAGVVKDPGRQTDFAFTEFISRATVEQSSLKNMWSWTQWGSINSASQLFVKLNKGVSPRQVEAQLVKIREKYREKNTEKPEKDDTHHALQPLSDIHFNADYDAFEQRQAHKPTLYGLMVVAVFLLLLGCINFINLTTAQAARRAKEIGIRKTIGSTKKQLIFQFLTETLMLTLIATILSVIITPLLLNIFSDFIPPGISFSSLNQPHVWVFLCLLVIVVSGLAGIYPALVLTKFKPVMVLKNQAYTGSAQTRKAWLRKTLTVAQFVIAQFFLIATLVVSKQIHYSINKDLGYKRDAIVFFNTRWNFFSDKVDERRFVLLEKLKQIPGIAKISLAGSPPASNNTSTTTMKYKGGKTPVETNVEVKYADSGYFGLYKMKLLAGKYVQPSDTAREVVINETYAKTLGFSTPANALGHFIEWNFNVPISGVIADFHTKSTHQAIKPLVYAAAAKRSFTFHLALGPRGKDGEAWTKTLAQAGKAFKEIYPEDDFNPQFYDKSIASFYKAEQDISRLLKWSTGLCIFISCLGLLGLVIYITNTRTKEIGVRKVLGASVLQLVSLLSKDFIVLVLIAFIVAAPLAGWIMHNWLQDFVYRTTISWWVFAVTGAGMIVLALLILGIRTVRSAVANPVGALRSE